MTPDPYRQAYEKAIENLTGITTEFERLSTRKKLVENLVMALQPVFSAADHAGPETMVHVAEIPHISQGPSAEALEPEAEPAGGYSFLDVPAPLPAESDGDPFQRRVRANFRFRGLSAQRSM